MNQLNIPESDFKSLSDIIGKKTMYSDAMAYDLLMNMVYLMIYVNQHLI
ncbi:hypothetical protein [Tepidibacter aestuarii]|nr:hypothetical protein [Tepidibacter aestuarii]CAH2215304.1 protein of unknown function [Tepidibacter aestuarii]